MAGALSAVAMRRLYAVFLLVVAIYFLVAPQGYPRAGSLKRETSRPEIIRVKPPAQVVH